MAGRVAFDADANRRAGDAGVMLRHGSPMWCLLAFGAVTVPAGLWLWHRQGEHFGLGRVSTAVAYGCLAALVALIALGLAVGGAAWW